MTSDTFFNITEIPRKTLIVGGGYIALEFSGILNSFGSKVTLVNRSNRLLRGFDADIVDHLTGHLKKEGIDIKLQTTVSSLNKSNSLITASLADADHKPYTSDYDCVIYATGRIANISKLNLAFAGLKADSRGFLQTDAEDKTSVDHIFAIGDLNNKIHLTPVAIQAGRKLVDRLFKRSSALMDYSNVPSAVFTPLEIGAAGYTEEQAAAAFGTERIETFTSRFTPLKYSMTSRKVQTFMKLIVDKSNDKVLGIHMIGPDAAEIIQGFSVAVHAGLSKYDLDETVGIHPSSAEEFVTMR